MPQSLQDAKPTNRTNDGGGWWLTAGSTALLILAVIIESVGEIAAILPTLGLPANVISIFVGVVSIIGIIYAGVTQQK